MDFSQGCKLETLLKVQRQKLGHWEDLKPSVPPDTGNHTPTTKQISLEISIPFFK